MQGKDTTIQEGVQVGALPSAFLEKQRTDSAYDTFYSQVITECQDLTFNSELPRQKRPPRRIDSGSDSHVVSDPKSYFRKPYFEALDTASNELKNRFCQERGMAVAAKLEKMLLHAANGTIRSDDYSGEIETYSKDLDKTHLVTQLQMLPELIRTYNECNPQTAIRRVTSVRTLCDVMNSCTVSRSMFNQVSKVLHILLTIPVTTSTAERSLPYCQNWNTVLPYGTLTSRT